MFYRDIDQNIALEEQNTRVTGSAAVADLLQLHLRLDVISKSAKGASRVIEARRFDLHGPPVAGIGCALQIGETIFFQDRSILGIGRGGIGRGLYAFRFQMPAAEGSRQRSLSRSNTGQGDEEKRSTQICRSKKGRKHHSN